MVAEHRTTRYLCYCRALVVSAHRRGYLCVHPLDNAHYKTCLRKRGVFGNGKCSSPPTGGMKHDRVRLRPTAGLTHTANMSYVHDFTLNLIETLQSQFIVKTHSTKYRNTFQITACIIKPIFIQNSTFNKS